MPPFDFPASPSEGQVFNAPSGPTYVFNTPVWRAASSGAYPDQLRSTPADMSIGFRTAGNRFVVNDGPSLNGTDVMTVAENGALATNSSLSAGNGFIVSATNQVFVGPTTAGTVYLRPNGFGSATGQTTIDSAGSMTVGGVVSAIQNFNSSTATVILAPTGAGTVLFRPNGVGSTTGQTTINSAGTMDVVAAATTNVAGISLASGAIYVSGVGTAAQARQFFLNGNGIVGQINTNASATAYNTSSDELLKDFIGPYDPLKAIDIIRRDPVRDFTWKADGTYAVGWGAQTSHAISQDLASPPEPPAEGVTAKAPGEDGYQPWGMDQSKRTPYLWAALSHALDKIDQLEARIAALEGA